MQRDQDWLREAQAELRAAGDLQRGGHWSWCAFTAQQAAEKALKAICEHLRIPHFGHNLNVLGEAVKAQITVSEALSSSCARLNRYYIPTRYPDAFDQGAPADQYFEADALQAVEDARAIVDFAEGVVGQA